MALAFVLPRLVFGAGMLRELPSELLLLGISQPLLISDRGLERAGVVATVCLTAPAIAAVFLDVPENPTAAGADLAVQAYRDGACDGIVALGGGSVLDTAKMVAALVAGAAVCAADLIGKPAIRAVAPLVAIPTTIGTGSESSPVAALHREPGSIAIGTRGAILVPKVALCDPDLARSLPRRLIAATAIDALSHCIEGFFAEPPHPVIDALALDGIARVFADVHAALEPEGDAARASIMAAAFAGGAAIHKGLGPAHAVALACADQHVHHGTVIGVALPSTTRLLATHLSAKAARVAAAAQIGDTDLGDALRTLIGSLGLPATLDAAGYQVGASEALVAAMVASPFNRSSPYVPTPAEYGAILAGIAG